jgi:hypothetical protein
LRAEGTSEELQQRLIACFPPIHQEVRSKLIAYIKTLEFRDKVKPNDKTKAEVERLKIELEGMQTISFQLRGPAVVLTLGIVRRLEA